MSQPDVQRYLNDIESQHQQQPRFMSHLTKVLEKIDAAAGVAWDLPVLFFIDQAEGAQLDIVGKLVGLPRTIGSPDSGYYESPLNDDQYRTLLYAKVLANQWDGTMLTFREIWANTLGKGLNAFYTDNQDMSVSVIVDGVVSDQLLRLIPSGYLIPKPMGVRYSVRNRLPEIRSRYDIRVGMSLYLSIATNLKTVQPDFSEEVFLADGLGNVMLDGHGVVLTI